MASAFQGCDNLDGPISDTPNLTNVTDMRYMFFEAYKFNQNIGAWNTSNVTDMNGMFSGNSVFTPMAFNNGGSDSIKNWNTSNVTDMSFMFYNASSFNQPIGSWDVSNVTDMQAMFFKNHAFNQPL